MREQTAHGEAHGAKTAKQAPQEYSNGIYSYYCASQKGK